MPTEEVRHCLNCGEVLTGKFCHACGQKDIPKRLSWKELRVDLIGKLFGMENGFGKTFVDLSVRPGEMVRGFLAGRRKNYQTPIQYYLIGTTLLFLLYQYFNFVGHIQDGSFSANLQGDELGENQKKVLEILTPFFDNMRLIVAFVPPGLALAYKWLFSKKTGYTYIEHLVFALFAVAHTSLLSLPVLITMKWFGDAVVLITAGLGFVYTFWAVKKFYQTNWLKAVFAYVFGYSLFLLVMMICMVGYVVVVMFSEGIN